MTTIIVLNDALRLDGHEVPLPASITYNAASGITTLGYQGEPNFVALAGGGGGKAAGGGGSGGHGGLGPVMSGLPGGTVVGGPCMLPGRGPNHEVVRQAELELAAGQPVGEYTDVRGVAARARAAVEDVFDELEALRAANKQLTAELAAAREGQHRYGCDID